MTGDETRGEAEAPMCEGRVVVRGFYGSDRCELDAGHAGPHRFVTTVTKYTTEVRNELMASGICVCSDPGFTHARELHDWLAARDRARDAEVRRVVEGVEAIHSQMTPDRRKDTYAPKCSHCQRAWPCPTLRALAEIEEGSP